MLKFQHTIKIKQERNSFVQLGTNCKPQKMKQLITINFLFLPEWEQVFFVFFFLISEFYTFYSLW